MPAKILVVDDEPDLEHLVRQRFRKSIRENELSFVFARNGTEALEQLKAGHDIDVVLTDINMPEMDGLTLLTRLGEIDTLLKSVIVSAYGDMENIRTAMNRGAFDFVTKPIDFRDLETTINKALRENQILRDALALRDRLVAIQQELNIAGQIQTSMLPRISPPFPDRKELAIHGKMIAAKEVGGDFYDFFDVDGERIGFIIGDVSGKGVPAALLMAMTRTLIRGAALQGVSPHECITTVNNALATEILPGMFVTVFYGIIDLPRGTLHYCCAGHHPPYVVSKDGRVKRLDCVGGLMVGAFPGVDYESKTHDLEPGDLVLVHTDGVTEARSASDAEFEEKGLERLLPGLTDLPIEEVVDRVVEAVQTFSQGVPQTDDITCLALRYLGAASAKVS